MAALLWVLPMKVRRKSACPGGEIISAETQTINVSQLSCIHLPRAFQFDALYFFPVFHHQTLLPGKCATEERLSFSPLNLRD